MWWFGRKKVDQKAPREVIYVYLVNNLYTVEVRASNSHDALAGLRAQTSAKSYRNATFVRTREVE